MALAPHPLPLPTGHALLLPSPSSPGLDHEWSLDQYGVLLEIGGGKERMHHYFSSCADREPWASVTGE